MRAVTDVFVRGDIHRAAAERAAAASAPAAEATAQDREGEATQPILDARILDTVERVMEIDGARGAVLVDWEAERVRACTSSIEPAIEQIALAHASVVKAKYAIMQTYGISGGIEDILVTLERQYHIIRPLAQLPGHFLYVAIDKRAGNLGLARHQLRALEDSLARNDER